jgi:hypothetical protein
MGMGRLFREMLWRGFQIAVLFCSAGLLFTIGLENMFLVYGLAALASFGATYLAIWAIDGFARVFARLGRQEE